MIVCKLVCTVSALTGLMGKDAFEEAHVNALCDAFTDMFEHGRSAKRATSEEDRV